MMHTLYRPVCDLLGCSYPIVLAGMGGVARSELVAAVTKAGGFGFLGMVREPVRLIQSEVTALHGSGIERFGVNLIPAATERALLDAQVLACIELGVPVVGLFWDVPLPLVQRLRDAGIVVVCQVGSLAEARAAEHAGAQILIAQGVEAGGHVRGDRPMRELVPEIAEQTDVPVLAAGGLTDGADLATVLSLGAQGGVFGTALIATPESFAHDYHKQRLVDASADDTVLTDIFHINWPRGAKVRVLASSVTRGERGDPFTEVRKVIGYEAGRPVYVFSTDSPLRSMTGDFEAMALYAGNGVGRVTAVVGAAERVRTIAAEASAWLDAGAPKPDERVQLASPACSAHEMDDHQAVCGNNPEEAEQFRLDCLLDEALDESFPASDPPAVHPHYTRRGISSASKPSAGMDTTMARIEFEDGVVNVDAVLVAEGLRLTPELVLTRIREGKITSFCERGVNEDAGRIRLTFFHGNRRVRLVVDEEGNVLDRSAANFHERPATTSGPGLRG